MKKEKIKFIIFFIAIISFLLNFFWEGLHNLLPHWNTLSLGNNAYFYITKIIFSVFEEIIYFSPAFFIVALLKRNKLLISTKKNTDYLFLILVRTLISFSIEIKTRIFGFWGYNQFSQLSLISTSALSLSNKISYKVKGGESKWLIN